MIKRNNKSYLVSIQERGRASPKYTLSQVCSFMTHYLIKATSNQTLIRKSSLMDDLYN